MLFSREIFYHLTAEDLLKTFRKSHSLNSQANAAPNHFYLKHGTSVLHCLHEIMVSPTKAQKYSGRVPKDTIDLEHLLLPLKGTAVDSFPHRQ